MKSKLINEIKRLQKIAGLLKEDDIDLSDTPQFQSKRTMEDYLKDSGFRKYMSELMDEEEVLDNFIMGFNEEQLEEFWEDYQELIDDLNEEEDLDLSNMPKFSSIPTPENVLDSPTFKMVQEYDFEDFERPEWLRDLYGFADIGGRCYMVPDLEPWEEEIEVVRLKQGWTVEKVLAEGIKRGHWFLHKGYYCLKEWSWDRANEWLNSLVQK